MNVVRAVRQRVGWGWGWLRRRLRRSPLASIKHGEAALADVARRSSCPVQAVSTRLGLPLGTTMRVMTQLEKAGLVRISRDIIESSRIVAITRKGRQELTR